MNDSNSIKVSVTVPVYNTERFLSQCLDSLLGQTLKELEIILVDDGSTDQSGAICDDYAKRDNRIKVFHKSNGGSASARQLGLENSNGTYYIICDSDDWVEPTMYEEMFKAAIENNADMVICDYFLNYPDGRQNEFIHSFDDFSQTTLIKNALTRKLPGSTCNKLVRLSVYRDNGLTWQSGINQGEDMYMLLQQLQLPLKLFYIPKTFYHYRRILSGNSYTNNPTIETFKQSEYINNWKLSNFSHSMYGRELFISTLNVAFMGIRTKGMHKTYYYDFINHNLPFKSFIKWKIYSLKSIIVFVSMIMYSFARLIYKMTSRFFYK